MRHSMHIIIVACRLSGARGDKLHATCDVMTRFNQSEAGIHGLSKEKWYNYKYMYTQITYLYKGYYKYYKSFGIVSHFGYYC